MTNELGHAHGNGQAAAIEALYSTGHWLVQSARHRDASAIFRAMMLMAPQDERGWLGLGVCHEGLNQPEVALQMYGSGQMLDGRSVRCALARARVLRSLGRGTEADEALSLARSRAEESGDAALEDIVHAEVERLQ